MEKKLWLRFYLFSSVGIDSKKSDIVKTMFFLFYDEDPYTSRVVMFVTADVFAINIIETIVQSCLNIPF